MKCLSCSVWVIPNMFSTVDVYNIICKYYIETNVCELVNFADIKFICSHIAKSSPHLSVFLCLYGVKVTHFIIMLPVLLPNVTIASSPAAVFSAHDHLLINIIKYAA